MIEKGKKMKGDVECERTSKHRGSKEGLVDKKPTVV